MRMHAVVQTLIFADISSGLGINAVALLSQIISFSVVFYVLWRWGFPVIIRTLDRRQAKDTIERAEKAAEREANRILDEANVRAQEVEQQYVARIRQEAAQAREELNRLVVNLSIDAAGKIIRKSVDNKDNRRLVQEFVSSSLTKEQ